MKASKQIAVGSVGFLILGAFIGLGAKLHSPVRTQSEQTVGAGSELSELSKTSAQAPHEGEGQAVECTGAGHSIKHLNEGEFIFGRPGALVKVAKDGSLSESSGEELADLQTVFDPAKGDSELPIHVECTSDGTPEESLTWHVSGVAPDQFFSTRKGVSVNLDIQAHEQSFFRTRVNTSCVEQTEHPEAQKADCVRPTLIAITDLNKNGRREFWALEPYMWETGIGVIEEPGQRILSTCPECPQ